MGRLETAVRTVLLTAPGMAAKVGTRVRPMAAGRADALPYIILQANRPASDGPLAGDLPDYRKASFDVAVYGATYDDVMDVADLARDRLDNFGETVAGVEFAPCMFDGETDVEQTPGDGKELPAYVRVLTFQVLFRVVP